MAYINAYSSEKPFLCIIINQRNFDEKKWDRPGTDVDRDKLKSTFEYLNCEVQYFENLTDKDIVKVVSDLSVSFIPGYNLNDYSGLVMCILSHGLQDRIMGKNGKFVNIYDDIVYEFRNERCPSLFNKPKIFIIQACQGEGIQKVVHAQIQSDASPVGHEDQLTRPDIIDFVIAMATIKGHVAYRDPKNGSPFIQQLCSELLQKGDRESFEDILKNTRDQLSLLPMSEGISTSTESSLTKNVIFKTRSTPP